MRSTVQRKARRKNRRVKLVSREEVRAAWAQYMAHGRSVTGATRRCAGRGDTCSRNARSGSDYCGPCADAIRCAGCGHHLEAHDDDGCMVNRHDGAEGPECECLAWEPR